jgi:hypothetical protein
MALTKARIAGCCVAAGAQRKQSHTGWRLSGRQLRDQRDPLACGNQGQHGGEVVGVMARMRIEARVTAHV